MEQKKKWVVFWMIGFVLVAMLMMYAFSMKAQLQQARSKESEYTRQIAALKQVQDSEAMKVNREFIQKFFEYSSTKQRYESIRPLMTDQGYRATFPSGFEPPDQKDSVSSTMVGLKPYQFQESQTKMNYLNEFKVTTKYNGVSSSQSIVFRTNLLYIDTLGWKVNDVEFVAQL